MRIKKYKVRIRNIAGRNGEQTQITFGVDFHERIGTDRCDIRIMDDKLFFIPAEQGAHLVSQKINLNGKNDVVNMRVFNGEYHAFIVSDTGEYYVRLSDKTGFSQLYNMKKNSAKLPVTQTVEVAQKKSVPKYKNPYLAQTAQETALQSIINAQNEKIRRLTDDIAEAEKLLAELKEERSNLVGIQNKAKELIKMLGGKE